MDGVIDGRVLLWVRECPMPQPVAASQHWVGPAPAPGAEAVRAFAVGGAGVRVGAAGCA